MPKPSTKTVSKFAIGDRVLLDMDDGKGHVVPCEVIGLDPDPKHKALAYKVSTDDGEQYDCEPHEVEAAPAGKAKAKPSPEEKPEEQAEEETEEPAKPTAKKGGGWNATKPAGPQAKGLPLGNHEAIIYEGVVEETGKKISAYLSVIGVNSKEAHGHTSRIYFNIRDEKGEWNDQGNAIFKQRLVDIGYTEEELELDESNLVEDLQTLLKKLKKKLPWVSIKVVPQKTNPAYTNIFIQGLMDDQENKPEIPELPY